MTRGSASCGTGQSRYHQSAIHTDDVIFAVASPPGRSPRGIVRMTGAGTAAILASIVRDAAGKPLAHKRGVYSARMDIGQHSLAVLAMVMPGPHSYTGEDTAELQLPGNPHLLDRVMQALLEAARQAGVDARPAEGGEFTARAFFNNKISLTQAEGVAATIAAGSDAQLRAAAMLRSGSLGTLAHSLADELASALALVEAGIDFTDQEDVIAISPADLHDRLQRLIRRIEDHLSRSVGMEALQAIPWVVLTGPPNAGKSTLFNAMLGRERAVVSNIAGTTRDVLAEPLRITSATGEAEVMLVDLAGWEDDADVPSGSVESFMQQAANQAMQRAELVLQCSPVDVPIEVGRLKAACPTIAVRTKCDLTSAQHGVEAIAVSAVTGAGIERLREVIAQRLGERAVSLAAETFALSPRHEAAMRSSQQNLIEALQLVEPMRDQRMLLDAELAASSMRAALNDLAALAGDITPDDVLGRVFSTFCVGK